MRAGRPVLPELLAKKARLSQRRVLAQKQKDEEEVLSATRELAELEAQYPELAANRAPEAPDRTATILEKNRLVAMKERKQMEEAEREARRRKAMGSAGGSSDVSRPGTPPVKDLSARVKTMSRLGQDTDSRFVSQFRDSPGLAILGRRVGIRVLSYSFSDHSRSGTPKPEAQIANAATAASTISSLNAVASSMELDLGDF